MRGGRGRGGGGGRGGEEERQRGSLPCIVAIRRHRQTYEQADGPRECASMGHGCLPLERESSDTTRLRLRPFILRPQKMLTRTWNCTTPTPFRQPTSRQPRSVFV